MRTLRSSVGYLFTVLASWLVMATPVLAGSSDDDSDMGFSGPSITNPLPGEVDTIMGFLMLLINEIILPIGSIMVVVMIIFTGFQFVVARGNEEKLSQAKTALTWTVVGAAVLLGSWVIAQTIASTICDIAPDSGACEQLQQSPEVPTSSG